MSKKITAKKKLKYKTDEERRLARNKRVRERRKRQRAAKKAAKQGKLERRAIPRRASDVTPVPVPPKKLAILLVQQSCSIFVEGEEVYEYDFSNDENEVLTAFAVSMDKLGSLLGAEITVHDLRPTKE